MGGDGIRAHVRDPAHHRRPAGRHLRPPPHLHHRRRAVRSRFVDRVGVDLGSAADHRRGDHRRHRRVADAAGDARAALGHVPRSRAGDRLRGVGCERGCRGRVRPGRRRVPHDELLVALVVPDQRDHRSARDHRRVPVHEGLGEHPPPREARLPRRRAHRRRHVPVRVRAQRGRHLRLVDAGRELHDRGSGRVAGDAFGLDHAARLRRRAGDPHARSTSSNAARSGATRRRCSSSRTCG